MVLQRNKPEAVDLLSDSQVDLKNNNNAIDDSFGDDHYPASDLSTNNGKHKVIKSVLQDAHPTTTVPQDVKLYCAQDHANIGPLQYTKQPVDKVQTPITCLQSTQQAISIGSSGTSDILDFMGVPYSYGTVIACGSLGGNTTAKLYYFFFWNGSLGSASSIISPPAGMTIIFSGSILRITTINPASNFSWTLDFKRIFTPT